MQRCMPSEWYIGHDQFVVYSFLGLLGTDLFNVGGYLTSKTYLSADKLQVDFAQDFRHLSEHSDMLSTLKRRTSHTTAALWDIIICWFFVVAIEPQFKQLLRKIVEVPDKRQTDLKLRRSWSISALFLLAY